MEPSRIIIAAGAVVQKDDGRILLVKHIPMQNDFWEGKWICPGGKVEVGEKIEETILREVEEETHLKVKLLKPIAPFERIVKREGRTLLHVVYIDYLAKPLGGSARPDSDVGELLWAGPDELSSIMEDLHDDTVRLLSMAGIL